MVDGVPLGTMGPLQLFCLRFYSVWIMDWTFHHWCYPFTEEGIPLYLILSVASVITDFIHRLALLRIAFWKIIILSHCLRKVGSITLLVRVKMRRPLYIAIVGILLCAGALWLEHGGASKIYSVYRAIVSAYQATDFAQRRSLAWIVQSIAADYEARQWPPPKGAPLNFHIDFNDWGHPLQYGWENGKAVIRAAGKDKVLYTADDITSTVKIRNHELRTNH